MKISVKRQTKRTTKWLENFADNINIFCGNFQFSIVTTRNWGDFRKSDEPVVEITLSSGRENYRIPKTEFELLIKKYAEIYKV